MTPRKWIVMVAVLLMLFSGPGCLGRFALKNKVVEFNLEATDHRWGREFVFLGLHIIPVYPIAGFIDLIILNSLEFWTGTNPISGESPLVDEGTDDDGDGGGCG